MFSELALVKSSDKSALNNVPIQEDLMTAVGFMTDQPKKTKHQKVQSKSNLQKLRSHELKLLSTVFLGHPLRL